MESDVEDPAAAPPRGRCCGGGFACEESTIAKALLRGTIVTILLVAIVSGEASSNAGARITVETVAYAAVAVLYICTASSRKEMFISVVFIMLTVVVVSLAATATGGRSAGSVIFGGNFAAISLYCIWKLDCLRRRRAPATAATAMVGAALRPSTQEEDEEQRRRLPPRTVFRIEGQPREYSYSEIQEMTQDFGCMVGRGGSAAVFRGVLDDGTVVAVKRIVSDDSVGEANFLREITIVASVHHYALVDLLGYSLQRGGGRYLVYPFFENRSLDSWLFSGEERRRNLPWVTRRHIAVDVAKALAYLHHECRNQILHLDIKPANVLLDGDFRAHVSDFGISMSIGRDLTSVDNRGRGTLGYMAPEILVNALSAKSDVYSYGMILFELVGRRRNFELATVDSSATPTDFSRDFLPYVMRDRMVEGKFMEVVDATMTRGAAGSIDEDEVEVVVKVAFLCTQHSRDMRPSMTSVVDMLEGRAPIPLLPVRPEFLLDTVLISCARTALSR
uniref:Protein kinase domain-containing protein n=1 Tax=Leersia perrieri TaxID=77586 RepID=A0A0D9V3I8_9ORYZ